MENKSPFYFSSTIANQIYNELTTANLNQGKEFLLPLGENEILRFTATQNKVLSELSSKQNPGIISYDIVAIGQANIYGKITLSNDKILGTLITEDGLLTIAPSTTKPNQVIVYKGNSSPEKKAKALPFACGVLHKRNALLGKSPKLGLRSNPQSLPLGLEIKTYRMAIAVTGEFYNANGNNDTDVLMAITFTLNALNLIYEKDLAVNFVLASTPILYDDPQTDPFTPDNQGGASRTDQASSVIGTHFSVNDYDIGHVFHTHAPNDGWSTGGIAALGAVCDNTFVAPGLVKAAGWSGFFNNVSNEWIQLLAHEIGHMFEATHTFNGIGDNCNIINLSENTAVEIGSGTTIMSYNGLCQTNNNIPSSGEIDNYFHTISLGQMYNYSEVDAIGSSCGTRIQSNNAIPQINANPNNLNYTIPISTPFELEGSGTDADMDDLSYCWEQLDEDGNAMTSTQGFIGATAAASPIAPLFRSIPPGGSPLRIFPTLEHILAGNNTGQDFEALPSVARTMDFSFTVRDNRTGGGTVNSAVTTVTVEDNGGAFEITSQNSPITLNFNGSNTFNVQWNVAGTTGGNILCSSVDIFFSDDGGNTFPFLLASNVANDGNETIQVPNLNTTKGRIKVKGVGNIFFDINNADITVNSNCLADGTSFGPDDELSANEGDAILDLTLSPIYGNLLNSFPGILESSDQDGILAAKANGSCSNFTNSTENDVYTIQVDVSGMYTFDVGSFGWAINIYEGSFDPNSPCTNLLETTNFISGGFLDFEDELIVMLEAGQSYELVANTIFPPPISYNITYSGPGGIFDGIPAPGMDYSYTYVILDATTNQILAFEDDPDLSNSSMYPAGTYIIRGVSFDNTFLSSSQLNTDFVANNLK